MGIILGGDREGIYQKTKWDQEVINHTMELMLEDREKETREKVKISSKNRPKKKV